MTQAEWDAVSAAGASSRDGPVRCAPQRSVCRRQCGSRLGARSAVLHALAMKHGRAFHPLDPRAARMRLVLATAVALVSWLVVPADISFSTRALLAWDSGGLVLLGFALLIIMRSDAAETRRRAAAYDPGRRVVWLVVIAGSAFSLFAAAALVRQGRDGTPFLRALHVGLCIATGAISWLVTHTAFTLRYAHLYYRDAARNGGIDLPGDDPPDDFDFAYFAFTIAMCFQVSDATISRQQIRRTALGHALLSFLYNTVILALALNLIIGQLG